MEGSEGASVNQTNPETKKEEAEVKENQPEITPFHINVITPHNEKIQIQVMLMDNIQDIRQYLLETPETCFVTSYHLEFNGVRVNDFGDLSEMNDVKESSEFRMVEDDYSETSARMHMRRMREILSMTCGSLKMQSPSIFTDYSKQTPKMESFKEHKLKEPPRLGEYYPFVEAPIKCLKKLCYSGWNPPCGNRKLQGDLFYLDIQTLEGSNFTVTSSPKGFYQNNTKQSGSFNSSPTDNHAHTLADLLRNISPKFKQSFAELIKTNFEIHPYELLPIPFPITPWLGRLENPSFDLNRAEEALMNSVEVDYHIQGQDRDWNEELQVCREHSRATIQDRIMRDRALFKGHSEFVIAAKHGAMEIINMNVLPINPIDEPRAHMYIFNNIFFSHALDSRDFYKDVGGDITAYKQASNDLQGVMAYNKADVKGIHTLGTAIIDYRGYRLVAQTIIPGLFSSLLQEGASVNIAYGSLEGSDLKCDEEFHKLMTDVAQKLYIKPHIVIGKDGSSCELSSHSDIKGIIGSDQRRYILDLVRTTPRDANYPNKENIGALLRFELLERYILGQRKIKLDELQKREEKKNLEQKLKEEDFLKEIQLIANEKLTDTVKCNPDLFTLTQLGCPDEDLQNDEVFLKKLAAYLKDDVVPNLAEDILTNKVNPVDSFTLTELMHSRGINMRYIGLLTKLVQKGKDSIFYVILLREMIVRVIKHIFGEYLRQTKAYELAHTVALLLNAFFSRAEASKKTSNGLSLSYNDLWDDIRSRVLAKYDFKLPEVIPSAIFGVPTLRAICLRVGIQLQSRNYDLTSETPFSTSEVLQMFPVVKHAEPITNDGNDLMEAAKLYMSQGRLDISYELLSEALAVLHQVYGPMHKQSANCYTLLARVLHDSDIQSAIQHQQKSVIINERVQGLDHYDTAHAYSNLSVFSHQIGPSKTPLSYAYRALYLNSILSEPDNFDNIDNFTNIGTILQELEFKEESRGYISKALQLSEAAFGNMNLQTARLYHVMALAYAFSGEFKEALSYETKNNEICSQLLGEKDLRTMESNIWMGQLTRNAVHVAKQQLTNPLKQRMESAKAKRESQSQGQEATATTAVKSSISSLPIEDVIKYIQSGNRSSRTGAVPSNINAARVISTSQARVPRKYPVASQEEAKGNNTKNNTKIKTPEKTSKESKTGDKEKTEQQPKKPQQPVQTKQFQLTRQQQQKKPTPKQQALLKQQNFQERQQKNQQQKQESQQQPKNQEQQTQESQQQTINQEQQKQESQEQQQQQQQQQPKNQEQQKQESQPPPKNQTPQPKKQPPPKNQTPQQKPTPQQRSQQRTNNQTQKQLKTDNTQANKQSQQSTTNIMSQQKQQTNEPQVQTKDQQQPIETTQQSNETSQQKQPTNESQEQNKPQQSNEIPSPQQTKEETTEPQKPTQNEIPKDIEKQPVPSDQAKNGEGNKRRRNKKKKNADVNNTDNL